MGNNGVIVEGGNMSLPWTNSSDSDSYQGMLRLRGNDIQYYDKGIWNTLPTSYATVRLDASVESLLNWVKHKQAEEAKFQEILKNHDHPAVKIAQENLNKAKEAVRHAEEQLKITEILSEEHEKTTS